MEKVGWKPHRPRRSGPGRSHQYSGDGQTARQECHGPAGEVAVCLGSVQTSRYRSADPATKIGLLARSPYLSPPSSHLLVQTTLTLREAVRAFRRTFLPLTR